MTEKTKTILVIDDDTNYLTSTRELLETQGYNVKTYDQPFGATALIKRLTPDLVLLDINMPALSGEKLAGIIRSNVDTERISIVFHSSNDEDSLRKAVMKYKVRGYICKGSMFDLREKVAYYLRDRGN